MATDMPSVVEQRLTWEPALQPGGMPLPVDPRLALAAEQLERTRWAAELFDADWHLVWVSSELASFLQTSDPAEIGHGLHWADVRRLPRWRPLIGADVLTEVISRLRQLANDPEPFDALLRDMGRDPVSLDGERYDPDGLVWATAGELRESESDAMPVHVATTALRDRDGSLVGYSNVYGAALPATLQALVARGDEEMFARMATLVQPGRRRAAVLFADLQASSPLSRRLPSAAFFELIAELTTAIDAAVIECGGLVGKHAGDGVTAFFLADHAGSPGGAAAAAIEAAQRIHAAAAHVGNCLADESGGLIAADEVAMNMGVHWGGTLYMGQVVTGGRLEVTALGDAVNEAARIQQSARGGEALVSKTLVEHLDDATAARLGLDPDRLLYRPVSDLPGATEKAIRDAGGIPVTRLPRPRPAAVPDAAAQQEPAAG